MPLLSVARVRRMAALVVCTLMAASCSDEMEMIVPIGDGGSRPRDAGQMTPPTTDGGRPVPTTCNNDAVCDDGVACTMDSCDTGSGRCRNVRDLSRCECDPACTVRTSGGGMGANGGFDMTGQSGVDFDEPSGGLIVRAMSRRADYLWVPNTGESTISKWDATMRRELARYRVGLPAGECRGMCCHVNGCNMTSRVAVDGYGNGWVANRGFSMQGTVSKIAAERVDCVDRNMNGMIDTSSGPMDVRPFGQDECVIVNVPVGPPGAILRAITIDRGDENFPEGYVWVGACAGAGASAGWQLNPRTGAVVQNVMIPHCAYGAVVAPDGRVWWNGGAFSRNVTPMDPSNGRMGTTVAVGGYGITVDAQGRLWFSQSNQGYDTRTGQITTLPIRVSSLGVTVDSMNRVWGGGTSGTLYSWDAAAFVPGGMVPMGSITSHTVGAMTSISAIGADRAGDIWLATSAPGPLTLYETGPRMARTFDGPNRVYTYTDFTGAVRRLVIGTGTYDTRYMAECESPAYADLTWDANIPMGTSLRFSLRTAATEAGLATATAVNLAAAPMDRSPVAILPKLMAAGVMPGRYARLTVTFTPSQMPVATPVLRSVGLSWRCAANPG
jgi:hypothetical protein